MKVFHFNNPNLPLGIIFSYVQIASALSTEVLSTGKESA